MAELITGKHGYKADQKIKLYVSTRYVGSARTDEETIEDFTGLTDEDMQNMTGEEIHGEIAEQFEQWVWENVDASWKID